MRPMKSLYTLKRHTLKRLQKEVKPGASSFSEHRTGRASGDAMSAPSQGSPERERPEPQARSDEQAPHSPDATGQVAREPKPCQAPMGTREMCHMERHGKCASAGTCMWQGEASGPANAADLASVDSQKQVVGTLKGKQL